MGEIAGVVPPEEQVKLLIEKGQTGPIKGFKSKSGKRFDAMLKLVKEEDGRCRKMRV